MTYDEARSRLAALAGAEVADGGPPLVVNVETASWAACADFARDAIGCRFFSFLTAVDHKDDGLEVVAWVENVDHNISLMLKTKLGSGVSSCPSFFPAYRGADWMERECYDMFGIRFDGHPDLRRILLPDDWEGFPLLKSYDVDTPYPPYR